MQNPKTMTGFLLATSLLLLSPGAIAAGPLQLDASASAQVDASLATDAVAQVKAQADGARAQLESTVSQIKADATAQVDATLDATNVDAQASAAVDTSAAGRAMAQVSAALDALKDFAASIFARASLDVHIG